MADTVNLPNVLEPPPRSTGDATKDFPLLLKWIWTAYLNIRQIMLYVKSQVETPEFNPVDLPDPATATISGAQQTANEAYTLADQAKTAADAAQVDADAAQSAATAAQTDADTAATDAASALSAANAAQSDIDGFVSGVGAAGSVLFSNGTAIASDNANLFFDNTANKLGVGTSSPSKLFHVNGETLTGAAHQVQSTAPTIAADQSCLWIASSSGTLDGQAYEQGDLVYTANVGGTQKTVVVVDWSAA
jgi:hypothetical protein